MVGQRSVDRDRADRQVAYEADPPARGDGHEGAADVGPIDGQVTTSCLGITDLIVSFESWKTVGPHGNYFEPKSSIFRGPVTITDGATVDLTTATYDPLGTVDFQIGRPADIELTRTTTNGLTLSAASCIYTYCTPYQPPSSATRTLAVQEAEVAWERVTAHSSPLVVMQWGPSPVSRVIDNAAALPVLAESHYDATMHSIGWTDSAPGAVPDAIVAGTTGSYYAASTWTLVAPQTTNPLRLPTLPGDLAGVIPGTMALSYVRASAGYDAIRRYALGRARPAVNSEYEPYTFIAPVSSLFESGMLMTESAGLGAYN